MGIYERNNGKTHKKKLSVGQSEIHGKFPRTVAASSGQHSSSLLCI